MKKNIALLTGGTTGEWVISVKSATTIAQNIDTEKYNVYKIMVTETAWFYEPADSLKVEIDKNDFSLNLNGAKVKFDGVFIVIHGSPGEDGKLQGYFDMLKIPYTTCNALTSAITMNKSFTKAVVSHIPNLHVAKSVALTKGGSDHESTVLNQLSLPLFVKTNNGGSSIGMTKVKKAEELNAALEKAFEEDDQVLVEEFVEGREFSIGAFQSDGTVIVLPTTEVLTISEFFDFDAKYTPGATKEITPGNMSEEEKIRVEEIIKQVYQVLGCRGVVRTDYFLQKDTGKFYFIEINTIPGQTVTSFIPQQVAAYGWSLKKFYSKIIEETLGI